MKILLVFTFNTSLKVWHEQGILIRELKVYKDLVNKFGYKITLLTYGSDTDINILKQYKLDDYFEIIPVYSKLNKSKFNGINILISVYFAFYMYRNKYYFDIVKTNQLYGSWVTILYKILTKSKLIIRTGFNPVVFAKFEKKSKGKIFLYTVLSKIALIYCNLYITTNKDDIDLITKSEFHRKKITYQPNFVDIDSSRYIKPIEQRVHNTLFSVGRLEEQKNHIKLIEMLKHSDYRLRIIGEGILKEVLIIFGQPVISSNLDINL